MPYLPALGSGPLRFQTAAPLAEAPARPAAGAPPVPALTPTESAVAQANLAAAQSAATSRPPAPAAPASEEAETPAPPPPAKPAAQSILPDDTRPRVRPEDFLPFFQIPGSARGTGDVNLIAPATLSAPTAAPLPPSTATYTQTPQ